MRKNVMLLIGYLQNGGAEHSIIKLAKELTKKHNVILVVVSKRDQDYETSVPIIEIPELKDKRRKILGVYKIRKLKKQYKIDVTISYTTVFNFYNVLSKYKDKTIISIRNHLSTKKEGAKATLLHKISIRLCDKIVCCSKSVKQDQLENYHAKSNKTMVITNFCDLEEVKMAAEKKLEKKDQLILNDKLIVTIARLTPHKGHKHIIKAMSLVVKKEKNARLVILGRGPMLEELEQLAKKYHLSKNIFFLGFRSNPYQFLNKAKCFVLASDYEGFPNVIIEALACGTPVIATDSPGGSKEILMKEDSSKNTVDILKTDYGILIPSFINEHNETHITNNEKILADAILDLLQNQDTYNYYRQKSLKRISAYKSDKVMKDWLKVIEEK